jgi:hypothetical protein
MIKQFNIPTNDQLVSISTFLNENLKDVKKENMTIKFELEKDLLRQIDEEYFFKYNQDAKKTDFVPGDEVNINILGINFKFELKINE